MKTPEIYYLQHKKNRNIVIVDKNNNQLQIVWLKKCKIGKKRKISKKRANYFTFPNDAYYLRKRNVILELFRKNKISVELFAVQGSLFDNQLSLF